MVDPVKAKREEILQVAKRHGVTRVRVFGSMARGDAVPKSDVDLLVDVGPNPSPWFPGGLVVAIDWQTALVSLTLRSQPDWAPLPAPESRNDAFRRGLQGQLLADLYRAFPRYVEIIDRVGGELGQRDIDVVSP